MSGEERDLAQLRATARALRHEPDQVMLARLRAAVRQRIDAPPSPWDVLAGWLRPAAISAAALLTVTAVLFALTQEPISPDVIAGSVLIEWEAQFAGQ